MVIIFVVYTLMHTHMQTHTLALSSSHTHKTAHIPYAVCRRAHICRSATLSLPSTAANVKYFSVAYLHYQWVLTTVPPIDTTTTYSSTYPDTMLTAEIRLQLLSNYKSSRS